MRNPRARFTTTRFVLVAFLISEPLFRASPANATHLSAPELHGSTNASAGPAVSVNGNTGDAIYALPIALPPGTAGFTPNLALTYNSGARAGSWAGLGWTVPVSSIRRSLRAGVPRYDGSDEYELDGQLLVYDSTQGSEAIYKTQPQSFLAIRFNSTTNVWTVTQPDGRRLSFGLTAQARITTTDGVFEWLLEQESDPTGNTIDYWYFQESGTAYLQEVRYGASPRRVVLFELESAQRPDTPVSYLAGFPQTLTRRLDRITVQTVTGSQSAGSPNIIRRYDLEYSDASGGQSPDSARTLLRAVALYGVGGNGTPLRTKFTYRQSTAGTTTGWGAWQSWSVTGGTITFSSTTRIADVNGDASRTSCRSAAPIRIERSS